MSGRRPLIAIILLASVLHGVGIARSILPAQDGLKFIKAARAFQVRPWWDVVRATDQHPLYPALVALAEPVLALAVGHGPDTWRLTAQMVAAAASIALLLPLHGLTTTFFNKRIADMATLGFVLLPLPMIIGHDTLSDSLALLAFVLTLRLGLCAFNSLRWETAVGCGLVAGVGFLARPEVLVAPLAVVLTGLWKGSVSEPENFRLRMPRLAGISIAFLVVVGSYALVKGEVSEKLAMRQAAAIGPSAAPIRKAGHWLPKGLDDAYWDFSPKEEPSEVVRRPLAEVLESLALRWSEGLGGVLAFFAIWGFVRDGHIRKILRFGNDSERPDERNIGRTLVVVYLVLFTLLLVRHEMRMGYLSDRHTLTLLTLSLPWAAAGVFVCAWGLANALKWSPRVARAAGIALLVAGVAAGVFFQVKRVHTSRWGHREAGRWLTSNADKSDAVLDTRGWAAFVSGLPAYDYWHVRQAFTDARLAYVVVGEDELKAPSRRAETLRAVLAYAAKPVAGFPEKKGGHEVGVWVYRYEKPESWEGLAR